MQDFFYIKNHEDYFQVFYSELLFIEAAKRYVRFVTIKKSYLTEGSLSEVESILPGDLFCRVHKSHIISLRHTTRFNTTKAIVGEKQLAIGRQYRDALLKKVTVSHGDVRITRKEINELFKRSRRK